MDEKLAQAKEGLIQAFGRQSAFWGLGRTAGEMYGVLYASVGPLSLEEVARRLKVTKGNVSLAIRQLEHLGLARRSWQTGDRRVFFEAETDFWKAAHNILSLRHKPEFDVSFKLITESRRLVEEAGASAEREALLERLAALQDLYRMLDSLVEMALAMRPDELRSVVAMLQRFARSEH